MAPQSTFEEWLTWTFSPTISAIVVTLLISIISPILVHWYLYRKSVSKHLPTFLLLGPSGGGKTSLMTLLAHGTASETHTSQLPSTTILTLPTHHRASADRFRSEHDPTTSSTTTQPALALHDTPGHGKLRHFALTPLTHPADAKSPSKSSSSSSPSAHPSSSSATIPALTVFPRGLIFVVDSAALSSPAALIEAATYLHDALLALQRRHAARAKSSRDPGRVGVLVAANKQDVFSALPAGLVGRKLTEEVGRVRVSRSRGVVEARKGEGEVNGVDAEEEEEEGWLGEFGSKAFGWEQMEEFGVDVSVVGGSVKGEEARVEEWWAWIGENL